MITQCCNLLFESFLSSLLHSMSIQTFITLIWVGSTHNFKCVWWHSWCVFEAIIQLKQIMWSFILAPVIGFVIFSLEKTQTFVMNARCKARFNDFDWSSMCWISFEWQCVEILAECNFVLFYSIIMFVK